MNKAIKDATDEALIYKSALNFKGRNVKAYAMVFAGSDCVYCELASIK